MGRSILFVTKGNKSYEEGFAYVVDLSKILKKSIHVLMIYDKPIFRTFKDTMEAAAFAEEGEASTAIQISGEWEKKIATETQKKTAVLIRKYCGDPESVQISFEAGTGDVISNIKKTIDSGVSIDMVLLSPSLSNISIKKILRNISMPLVTMSKLSNAGT
ncbi:MAG: hypothetical protein AB1499_15365 [Nitrospirota bacterium]